MTNRPRPRFTLPSSASIPFGTIDAEHDGLIALIDHARDVSAATHGSAEKLFPLYRELQQTFEAHFANEERTMEETGYPGLASHRAHHGELLEKANAVCERARTGFFTVASELEVFFDSIIDDALRADLPFKSHLMDKGLIPS